ncbi:hypothetical protein, partial [Burkholderia sola]|uniref:hypothetical protein n=1 Tax=Burkholderia sola TaxID=2843302 RepID=UPI00338D9013
MNSHHAEVSRSRHITRNEPRLAEAVTSAEEGLAVVVIVYFSPPLQVDPDSPAPVARVRLRQNAPRHLRWRLPHGESRNKCSADHAANMSDGRKLHGNRDTSVFILNNKVGYNKILDTT